MKQVLARSGATVYPAQPMIWARLPSVTWREVQNRSIARADGKEYLTERVFSIDIWSRSAEQNRAIYEGIAPGLAALRLRRDWLEDLYESGRNVHHRHTRWRCVVDDEGRVYQ